MEVKAAGTWNSWSYHIHTKKQPTMNEYMSAGAQFLHIQNLGSSA